MIGPTAKILISLFVLAALYYQWSWDLPDDSIFHRSLKPVRRRLARMGLGQNWKMFAPNPPSGGGEMRFEIDGRDGRRYVRPFPLDDNGPGWGRPQTRVMKARQSLVPDGSRRLVDEHLPAGPAQGRDWTGPARVRCFTTRQLPPPLDDLDAAPPPPFDRVIFDIELPPPGPSPSERDSTPAISSTPGTRSSSPPRVASCPPSCGSHSVWSSPRMPSSPDARRPSPWARTGSTTSRPTGRGPRVGARRSTRCCRRPRPRAGRS
jgi:hypothetical protein